MPYSLSSPVTAIFGIDLRALACMRISLSVVMLIDLIQRSTELTSHYTNDGLLPRHALIADPHHHLFPTFHTLIDEPWFIITLFFLHGLAILGLLFGYRTRLMTALCWLFGVSLHNRNLYITSGGDSFILLLLFFSVFLPLGKRYAIDARHHPPANEQVHLSIAGAALILQIISLYFFGALLKTDVQWIPDGSAVYAALHSLFALDWAPAALLREWTWAHRPLTYAVYGLELIGPLLLLTIWHPLARVVIVALLALMHLGFALTLNIGHFPYVNLSALLVLLPPALWNRLPLPSLSPSFTVHKLAKQWQIIAALPLCLMLYYNIVHLPGLSHRWSPDAYRLMHGLRLAQYWNMFAPYPFSATGWLLKRGVTQNGRIINLRTGQPVQADDFTKPHSIADHFGTARQLKYASIVLFAPHKAYLYPHYADWVCHQWNHQRQPDDPSRITHSYVTLFIEQTMPDSMQETTRAWTVAHDHRCHQ